MRAEDMARIEASLMEVSTLANALIARHEKAIALLREWHNWYVYDDPDKRAPDIDTLKFLEGDDED